MPRIAGVDIPDNKPITVALRYIHGIGPTSAARICESAGIEGQTRSRDLTEEELSKIAGTIDSDFVVEGELRRRVRQNIQRLGQIQCYRGLRHRRGLPVHGQRTKTNARTRKGPRKTVAGKRSVKEMR
ncbi:MAG: 30S ribosomal protein S13 [Phycisphaerae bacterium]